jgi:hypothetical protein
VDALELKADLENKARDRSNADRHKRKATEEAAGLMRLIPQTEGVTMGDAAEILGVSRVMAYKMLKD